MVDDENRSRLCNEIKGFLHRNLRKVQTKVTTGSGEHLTEKRSPKGLTLVKSDGIKGPGYVVDHKPDLQVGMIIPGLFIASQDVAQDKSLLETYSISHILNLAYGVENAFEDDFNYKKLDILDLPETDITQYFEECFDFISEGVQRGNCLVHCNAGVSRSTAICCAYLMKKQKMKYNDALALVREARAFAKPNEGFAKQLENYNDQLFGQLQAPDEIEDAFVAKKKAEREAEKAAILGTSVVKKQLKNFGPQLESIYAQKLRSMTPIKLPLKKKPPAQNNASTPSTSKQTVSCNNAPPPPPPPPMQNSKTAPPPPPPPPLNQANKIKPAEKSRPEPKKLVIKPVKLNDPNSSPTVDETPITVAAQRKLWESTNNNADNNSVPKIQKIPATPNNNIKSKIAWNPEPKPSPSPVTASPEPERKQKKIIIKQRTKDSPDDGTPRRGSTKDLVKAIEAVSATNSQSSTPYSSPGPQRRQMHYGRRQTHQIGETVTNTPPATRKPMWSLRDQVDSLVDSSTPGTPRSRSPIVNTNHASNSIASTPRHSKSPSPPRFNVNNSSPNDSDSSCRQSSKVVFGRVPPRKVSLSGKISANNADNELPVVAAPKTTVTSNQATPSVTASVNSSKPASSADKKNSSYSSSVCDANHKPVSKTTVSESTAPQPVSNNQQSSTDNEDQFKLRSGFKKMPLGQTKERSVNRSVEARRNKSGLNRSSTAEILKLIKTKSRADFGMSMETVDEDVEIEYLLGELQKEGLDNIAWDEIGVDEKEVKNIVEKNRDNSDDEDEEDDESVSSDSSDSESESEESSSEEESDDDEMQHTVFSHPSTVVADKPKSTSASTAPAKAPMATSKASIMLQPASVPKTTLVVEEGSSSEEEEDDSEEETDSD